MNDPQSSLFQRNVLDNDIVTSRNSEAKLYACSQCERSFTCRQGLYEHKLSMKEENIIVADAMIKLLQQHRHLSFIPELFMRVYFHFNVIFVTTQHLGSQV